jgi:hypothetical protein
LGLYRVKKGMPFAAVSMHLLHLLTLLLLPIAAAFRPPAQSLDAGLAALPAGPERAVWATGELLGAPYIRSPLGDATGPESGPRFRLDAFDCVTFVETAIALGNADKVADAERLLDDIRYDGPPDYDSRNHYIESQWLLANLRKGWIAHATAEIAGSLTVISEKEYTPETWAAAKKSGVRFPLISSERRPKGRFVLPLVPADRVMEIADRIPVGTILVLVRTDQPWRPYRVSHMGIVAARANGRRVVRHASDVPTVMRVRDEPLDRFLARSLATRVDWPVTGVSFYSIRNNSRRVKELQGR